jgi:riboflavin kinase, archaea type
VPPTAPPPPQAPPAEALALLKVLAELGAAKDHVPVTSGNLAERLGCSQQTASRRVLEVLDSGLVQRRMGARGQWLRLTPKGVDALRREFEQLRSLLEGAGDEVVRITGTVAAGLGEGGWYISRKGYQKAFRERLGFTPAYGTLNLAVGGEEAAKVAALRAREGLLVPEFQDEGRTFGAVRCFPARLGGIEAGVVFPLRGHHRDVLEVVAPVRLRDALGLQDGDEVAIEVRPA